MTSRFRIATHISIALALMSVSLVMLAHSLGLVPDPREERARLREMTARLVADCAIGAVQADDFTRIGLVASELVKGNPDVRSVGVRLGDGRLVFATERHEQIWTGDAGPFPTQSEASIPVLRDGEPYASVEVRFEDGAANGLLALAQHPAVQLAAFVGGAGFLAYRLYMRHVLQYLDPSEVIPERVRLVLDSLAEAVMILDRSERLVLANRAWLDMNGAELQQILGVRATSFDWRDSATGASGQPAPWIGTLEDGAVRTGVRLELATGSGVRLLSVTCSPIIGPDKLRRGVLVTLSDLTESETQRGELEELLRNLARSRREIEHQNAELKRLATTDPLTMCFNRRELFDRAEKYWALAERSRGRLSCIMIDVDHFKQVNDNFGHQTGDALLAHVAGLIRAAARTQDVAGRYGGEEFCVLLPDTPAEEAAVLAERIRAAIEGASRDGPRVTVSLGVADNSPGITSVEELFDRADRALYEAKRAGRNVVRVAPRTAGDRREVA